MTENGEREGGKDEPHPWRRLATVLGNITVLTALLFYFGWRRSEAQAAALGLDQNILGQGTQDYLLRSIDTLLPVILGVALTGLLWLWLDGKVHRRLRKRPPSRRRRPLGILSMAWIAVPAVAFAVGLAMPDPATIFFPLSIAAGFLLTAYAFNLRRRLAGPGRGGHNRGDDAFYVFIAVIVSVALFWAAANYAQVLGQRLADEVNTDPSQLVPVVVYSEKNLHLDAPGVTLTQLQDTEDAPVLHRYDGLRLLQHVGSSFFLISDGWNASQGTLIELKDQESVRFDFIHRPLS